MNWTEETYRQIFIQCGRIPGNTHTLATLELKKDWDRVCKANPIKKWTHHKKDHIKISKFTEFGDVWLDSDHVVSF